MTSLTTVDGRALVDQLEHARAGRLDAERAGDGAAVAQRLGPLRRQVLLGLEVGRPAQVEAGVDDRLRELDDRLGRDRVLREIEVARPVLRRERRRCSTHASRRRARDSWRCRPRRGRSGRTCTCPSSSRASDRRAGRATGEKYVVERQPVEVGRGQARRSSMPWPGATARPSARSRMHDVGAARAAAASRRARGTSASSVCSPSKTTAESNGPSARASAGPRRRMSICVMPGPPHVRCTSGSARLSLSANAYAGCSCPGKQTESRRRRRSRRAAAATSVVARRRRRTDRARARRRARSRRAS